LVFCRRMVVPTVVALPATRSYLSAVQRDPRLVMLCYSYPVYSPGYVTEAELVELLVLQNMYLLSCTRP